MLLCLVSRLDAVKRPVRGLKSRLSLLLQHVASHAMKEEEFAL